MGERDPNNTVVHESPVKMVHMGTIDAIVSVAWTQNNSLSTYLCDVASN